MIPTRVSRVKLKLTPKLSVKMIRSSFSILHKGFIVADKTS